MIKQTDDAFVIASKGQWLPGVYATRQAAQYAFRFPDEALRQLQESINPDGKITTEMLRELHSDLASAKQEATDG